MNVFERMKFAAKVLTSPQLSGTELSSYISPLYRDSTWLPYNPDELVQKRGGLDVYRRMMFDDQVKAVMMMKIGMIIGSGFQVVSASDDAADAEIANYVRYALTDGMDTNFRKALRGILSNHVYGFSVMEKVFKRIESGDYAGKIGYKAMKMRPPHSFELHVDAYGNLQKLRQSTTTGYKDFTAEDLRYFVVSPYYGDNTDDSNPYGTSDLRAAYRAWWSKDVTIRFLNIFLERFGMGVVVARYPRGLNTDEKNDISDMIKNITAKTSFRIPKEVEIEILESARNGQAGFIEAVSKHDRSIARSLLVPDLLGYSDAQGGTYNLGENQIKMFFDLLESDREDTEEIVAESIIKDLVDVNFSHVTKYPKFKFNPLTKKDKDKISAQFISAVKEGVILPTEEDEEHMRDMLEFPKRTDESILLPRPTPVVVNPNANGSTNNDDDTNDDDILAGDLGDQKGKMPKKFVQDTSLSRPLSKYEKKIDFKQINFEINTLENEAILELGRVVTRMRDELTSTIARRKIVEERNFDEVEKLDVKFLGDLRLIWKDILRRSYKTGLKTARGIIKTKSAKFAAKKIDWSMPPEEALAYFERRAFTLAGDERDFILKNVKQYLYNGIKNGDSLNKVIYNVESFFEKYTVEQKIRVGNKTLTVPIEEAPNRIETIVRTNYTDAYNQGLFAIYTNDDVKEFTPALMYSTIMDGRQTELCASLDQKVYKTTNPVWQRITPPNHHQCRAMILPVLADEWDGIESDLPEMYPDPSFGG